MSRRRGIRPLHEIYDVPEGFLSDTRTARQLLAWYHGEPSTARVIAAGIRQLAHLGLSAPPGVGTLKPEEPSQINKPEYDPLGVGTGEALGQGGKPAPSIGGTGSMPGFVGTGEMLGQGGHPAPWTGGTGIRVLAGMFTPGGK